jgi:transposase
MSKQRRTFSADFKREAAALVLDQGYSNIEACRSLGIVDSALLRWETAPRRASRRHAEEQSADARAAEDPGAGGQDHPAGTGESDINKGYRASVDA